MTDAGRGAPPPMAADSRSSANRILVAVGILAALVYGSVARVHRRLGRWFRGGRGRPSCAVLSVGGLTVGGSGKTPVAAALALGLHRRGRRVALASRGYGGDNTRAVLVVSDGRCLFSSVGEAGDEALLLAAHAPGVPVLIGRDRLVVGHHAVSSFDTEILVLDDGFQHHRLARDLDVVCIDGRAGLGNRRVLPAGPLREPCSALRDADWLCVVDGGVVDGDGDEGGAAGTSEKEADLIADFVASGRRVLRARRAPRDLTSLDRKRREPLSSLVGRSVGLLAGVGRPGSVRRTLESLGARICAERLFPDHHAYRPADLESLDPAAREWITTEKDALKILPAWCPDTRIAVLGIEVEFEDETATLDAVEAALRDRGQPRSIR